MNVIKGYPLKFKNIHKSLKISLKAIKEILIKAIEYP